MIDDELRRDALGDFQAQAEEHGAVVAMRHEDADLFEACMVRCSAAPNDPVVRVEIMDSGGGRLLYLIRRSEWDECCAEPQPLPDDED